MLTLFTPTLTSPLRGRTFTGSDRYVFVPPPLLEVKMPNLKPYKPLPFSAGKVEPDLFSMPLNSLLLKKLKPLENHLSLLQLCEWGLNVAAYCVIIRNNGNVPVLVEPRRGARPPMYEQVPDLIPKLKRRMARPELWQRLIEMPPVLQSECQLELQLLEMAKTPAEAMQLLGQSAMLWFANYAEKLHLRGYTLRVHDMTTNKLIPLVKKEAG